MQIGLTWVSDGHLLPIILVVLVVDRVGRPPVAHEHAVEDGEQDLDDPQRDGEPVLRPLLTHDDCGGGDGRERTDASIESTKARVSLVMNYSAVKAVHSRGDQGIGGDEIFRMFSHRSSRALTERVSESEIAPEYRKLTSRNVFRDVAGESSFRNAIMPRAESSFSWSSFYFILYFP